MLFIEKAQCTYPSSTNKDLSRLDAWQSLFIAVVKKSIAYQKELE
jgi:hypothetical protein